MGRWTLLIASGLMALATAGSALAQQGFGEPRLDEKNLKQVSTHVWVIMGFPNVGFVVGSKSVLVVDTGLGAENGALMAKVAQKLGGHGQKLILTTTHFHPEHASGQAGFPPGTEVIRNRVQQEEYDAEGQKMIDLFAARGGEMGELLKGAKPMKADVLFDKEAGLDLGGVHVRLFYFGPAHTRGDEIVYVPEDLVLIPGDVVQNRISPNIICATCSPKRWLAVLAHIVKLPMNYVVPDHGDLGGRELVGDERGFLIDLQQRAMALKDQGISAEDAGASLETEFKESYGGWSGLGNVPQSVERAYADPGLGR